MCVFPPCSAIKQKIPTIFVQKADRDKNMCRCYKCIYIYVSVCVRGDVVRTLKKSESVLEKVVRRKKKWGELEEKIDVF